MAKKKYIKSGGAKSKTGEYLVIGGAALAGLYLLTRNVSPSPSPGPSPSPYPVPFLVPGPEKTTVLREVVDNITNVLGKGIYEVAITPGQIFIEPPLKALQESERVTSEEIFKGESKKDVSTFGAIGGTGRFATPVTYQQFIEQQPLAFRGAAATGNIITAQYAGKYGQLVAEETKKGQAISGVSPENYAQRFSALTVPQQAVVSLGQALTVPFGGGGASGWAAATKKQIVENPLGFLVKAAPILPTPLAPLQMWSKL